MIVGRSLRRLLGFLVHNWPLKLAAIVLATLLYAGLIATQDSNVTVGPIAIVPVNQPGNTVITNQLRDVEQVRYIAPADLGRLRAEDFRATVDIADVAADGTPVSLRVSVVPVDARVTILEIRPRTVQVVLDTTATKTFAVSVVPATPPAGLQLGETVVTPADVEVSGPSAAVNRVAVLRVNAPIDASGLDVDRSFAPIPLDASGQVVSGVDINPATVHVSLPVYANRETRSLPVNPIVTGSPGAGFRIDAVRVTPVVVTVMGDAEQLQALTAADTAPVAVTGATRDVTADVVLALPPGVSPVGVATVRVIVTIAPVTETRTYVAGIRMDGISGAYTYDLSDLHVLLTLFGSTADLDTLSAAPIVVALNVTSLEPGSHEVAVVPSLPSGVTVADISPSTVTVTVTARATPAPSPSPTPAPSPSPTPTPAP